MKKIRIRRSTVDRLFELLFKVLMAFVFAVFVGIGIGRITGSAWCGAVAVGASYFIIYYVFEHIEIVKDGK